MWWGDYAAFTVARPHLKIKKRLIR